MVLNIVGYFVFANFKGGIKSFKEGMDSVNKNEVTYRYAKNSTLTEFELFALALDAVITAYWEVDNNTLDFTHKGKKPLNFEKYMSGWFIDTKAGYEELRDYFFEEGRRSYFDFIYPLYKNNPKEEWEVKMQEKYSGAARPRAILARLSEHDVVRALMQEGIIDNEEDIKIGMMAWDISVLIGQARRAYTAGLVSELEALQTIERAKQMAVKNFNSWKDFGRSQVIGMALDYYRQDDDFF
jgi:hypothetical protein